MAHRSILLAALAPLLTLVACSGTVVEGPTPPTAGVEKSLTKAGGCGDVYLYVSNPEDTVAIFAETSKFITVGTTHASTFSLPTAELKVQLQVGRYLTHSACNDVVENAPQRDTTYVVTSGKATLTTVPSGTGGGPMSEMSKATLRLENLVLRSEKGQEVTIPLLEIKEVPVGWYAG